MLGRAGDGGVLLVSTVPTTGRVVKAGASDRHAIDTELGAAPFGATRPSGLRSNGLDPLDASRSSGRPAQVGGPATGQQAAVGRHQHRQPTGGISPVAARQSPATAMNVFA